MFVFSPDWNVWFNLYNQVTIVSYTAIQICSFEPIWRFITDYLIMATEIFILKDFFLDNKQKSWKETSSIDVELFKNASIITSIFNLCIKEEDGMLFFSLSLFWSCSLNWFALCYTLGLRENIQSNTCSTRSFPCFVGET